MAKYKITKYKGKSKIKDVKTGKSVDIDIEKFMDGGYSLPNTETVETTPTPLFPSGYTPNINKGQDTPQYMFGGTPTSQYILPTEEESNLLQEELDFTGTEDLLNNTQFQTEARRAERYNNRQPELQDDIRANNLPSQNNFQGDVDRNVNIPNQEDTYNIFNPYAGVDIPGAVYNLGSSISNKDTFGTVTSGIKLAAGLGRNIVGGLGQANRYNQVSQEAKEDARRNRNVPQYIEEGGKLQKLAYGGKKEEELATGEYMQGVTNEDTENFNAEIEQGEYFQTNVGDISEVVGNKHSQGGEKIQMEEEDRVLSDKLTLGKEQAKTLSEKYDMKLKAKHTYSDVLDKFRKKSKLDKIIEEESEIIKKVSDQAQVKDIKTRDFNLQVLAQKKQEVEDRKNPLEEERKAMFDELFNIQEESKPPKENSNNFAEGGKLEALANEYNIPIERARELVESFKNGGKKVPKYEDGEADCGEGFVRNAEGECIPQRELTKEEAEALENVPEGQSLGDTFFGGVTPDSFQDSVKRNEWYFKNHPDFDPTDPEQVRDYQIAYNKIAERLGSNPVQVDGKWGEQTDSIDVRKEYRENVGVPAPVDEVQGGINHGGLVLFPDESPLPPTALQGTLKPEARFDRVRPTEINVEPYLQDIRNNQQTQIQNLEGLSPSVRAAVLANVSANTQQQESNTRNQIDTQNLQSQEKAIYTNANIQMREQLQNNNYRQSFENRTYQAQANTNNDINNYYNQLQSINSQRFRDIDNLNLINATNEDVYFDGQSFKRKNSDQDILSRIKV